MNWSLSSIDWPSARQLKLRRRRISTSRILTIAASTTAAVTVGLVGVASAQTAGSYLLHGRWPDPDQQSPEGTFITPTGIDVAEDGTVAVVDRDNHRLQLFDAEGNYLKSIGEPGTGSGQLFDPRDVAFAPDRILVTDTSTGRIVLFDRDGGPMDEWHTVTQPWGIAYGSSAKAYVTSRDAGEIAVLNMNGDPIETIGRSGSRSGEFLRPQGVDVAADGSIAVADTGNVRVQMLTSSGRHLATIDPRELINRNAGAPEDVVLDERGNVLFTSSNGLVWVQRQVDRSISLELTYNMTGAKAVAADLVHGMYVLRHLEAQMQAEVWRYEYLDRSRRIVDRFGRYGGDLVRLSGVRGVTAAPGDNLAVLTSTTAAKYSQDGRFEGAIAGASMPQALTFLPSGDVVVASQSLAARYTAAGQFVWRWPATTNPVNPRQPVDPGTFHWITALEYDPGNNVIYAVDVGVGKLVHLDPPTGSVVAEHDLSDNGAFVAYRDLAIDESGDLVLVNQTSRRIEFRSPDWDLRRVLAPRGVPSRVSALGSLTFVLTRDGWVWRYGPDLVLDTVWNGGGGGHAVDVHAVPGRVFTADRESSQILDWRYDATMEPSPPPTAPESVRCALGVDKTADPPVVLLGEEVDITLTIGGTCPDIPPQADIVLVLDRSGSMQTNTKMEDAKQAALAFLDAVDFTQSRVAVVKFNQTANLEHPLTDNKAQLQAVIRRLSAQGGTNITLPTEIATEELTGPRRRPTALGVIILLTDGNDNTGPLGPTIAGLEAKLDGIRFFAIGLGADVNGDLLRMMASTPDDYYFAPDSSDLTGIYADIARRIKAEVLARTLVVSDELPTDMSFKGMIRGPDPTISSRQLTWALSDVSFSGLQLVYRVLPDTPGHRNTNVSAEADYVDGLGHGDRLTFPVPRVLVLRPRSPTPTVTPTPTPTRPPQPTSIYLPFTGSNHCQPRALHADVVLVIDTSTSMLEQTRSGRTKLEAAIEAANTFLGLLVYQRDQAAIVSFNRDAHVAASLGSDRSKLGRALVRLEAVEGTRIDLGLKVGTREVLSRRHWDINRPVIILLTDGIPNGTTHREVIARAVEARAGGVEVFTIGLGSNVDPALLASVATDRHHRYLAPDGEDLAAIYRAIAAVIPCP